MGERIRDIVIVGGGTAGWLAAAHLNHRLQWGIGHSEGVRVTLIESPDVPTIGVGEATIPPIRATLHALDIDEAEFIARTQATFKLGVRFDDWDRDANGRPLSFHHPFSGGVQVAGRNPAASLLAYGVPEDLAIDPQLGNVIGHGIAAACAGKSPRRASDPPYEGLLSYAYHFDAGLLAAFLAEVCVARGVHHVRDTVTSVERDHRGHIAALQLAQGGRRAVELVIDCSGFRGLLINEALGEPFISYADRLFNDRAVAVQIAHDDDRFRLPVTVSTASEAGWSWRIPLRSRIGTGHVYSSAFLDDDAATDSLMRRNAGHQALTDPRIVRMRVGRCRRSWVGNCVAIGLSSGFIEPLESTSIQFVDYACQRLLQCLPTRDFEPAPIAKFNARIEEFYDEVRDFLGLHYTLGNRTDTPYWHALRDSATRSEALERCLDLWAHALPDAHDPRPATAFNFWSVACVLSGKRFWTAPPSVGTDLLPPALWDRYIRQMAALQQTLVASLPDHGDMLRDIVAGATMGATVARRPPERAVPRLTSMPAIRVMTSDPISAASVNA